MVVRKPSYIKCSTIGWYRTSANTRRKIIAIFEYARDHGYKIGPQIYGYVGGTNSHVDHKTVDIMAEGESLRAIGRFIWSKKEEWDLHYVVIENTIYSTTPGRGGDNGLPFTRDNSHRWHAHATWRSDRFETEPERTRFTGPLRVSLIRKKRPRHVTKYQEMLIAGKKPLSENVEASGYYGPNTKACTKATWNHNLPNRGNLEKLRDQLRQSGIAGHWPRIDD